MPISDRLERKIYEVFGQEAGSDLLIWMRDIEARHTHLDGLRAEVAALRRELHAALTRLEITR